MSEMAGGELSDRRSAVHPYRGRIHRLRPFHPAADRARGISHVPPAVGRARWAALLVGFCGVLIVTNPGTETFQIGALFALANAVLYGSVTAAVRSMSSTESAETLTLYQLALLTAIFTLMLPLGWTTPTAADTAWIVLNGASNAVGQYWWTRALHLAPASAVAPFYYLSLIWASILGFAVWGEVPTISLVIGSAVVVASGLFLFWRESSARQRAVAAAARE